MSAFRKILVMVVLTVVVFSLGFLSGCMTLKGLASDIEEASGAINRGLKPMEESRRQVRLDRAAQLIIETKKGVVSSN